MELTKEQIKGIEKFTKWLVKNTLTTQTKEEMQRELFDHLEMCITEELLHIQKELGTINTERIKKMIDNKEISADSYNNFRVDCNLIAMNIALINKFIPSSIRNDADERDVIVAKLAKMTDG